MRKVLTIAGAGLAGLALVGIGAKTWAEQQLIAEVEALFDAARASGAVASHGPIAVSLLDRQLDIPDVVVERSGGDASTQKTSVRIAMVTATGLGLVPGAAPVLAAAGVRLTALAAEFPSRVGGHSPPTKATALQVTIADLALPARVLPAAGDTPEARWQALLRTLAEVRIARIASPEVKVVTAMTNPEAARSSAPRPAPGQAAAPAPATLDLTTTYTDIELRQIAGGKIGMAVMGGASLSTPATTPPLSGPLLSGTVGRSTFADTDILAQLGADRALRPLKDGYVEVQGKSEFGAVRMQILGAGLVEIGGIAVDAVGIDPAKLNRERLGEFEFNLKALSSGRLLPRQAADTANDIAEIYEGIRMTGFVMRDMKVTPPAISPKATAAPAAMSIGAIRMASLVKGRLSELVVEDMTDPSLVVLGVSDGRLFSSVKLAGLDLAGIIRLSGAFQPGQPPDPAALGKLAPLIEGIDLRDVAAPDPGTGKLLRYEIIKADWGKFLNGIPTRASVTLKGTVPLSPVSPQHLLLMQAGLSELTGALDLAVDWDEPTQTVRLSRGAVDVDGLGAFTLAITLGAVDRSLFVPDPRPVTAALPGFEVGDVTITVADKGINALISQLFPAPPAAADGSTPNAFAELRQQLTDPQNADSGVARLLTGIEAYAAQPGKTLSLKLKPRGKVKLGELLVASGALNLATGALMLERFEVTATVAP